MSFHFPSTESQSKVIPSMQFTFPIKLLGRLVSLQLSNDWFIFNFLYRLPLPNNAPKQSIKECISRDTPPSLYSILRYLRGWSLKFEHLDLGLSFSFLISYPLFEVWTIRCIVFSQVHLLSLISITYWFWMIVCILQHHLGVRLT